MLGAAGLAAWRGRWEARTIAFGMVVESLAATALQDTHDVNDVRVGGLILAVIYLVALVWVALRSARGWTLWTAAFQLVAVAVFLARMADTKIGALAQDAWGELILIVVAAATLARPAPPAGGPSPLA